jgi:hypothetical protein
MLAFVSGSYSEGLGYLDNVLNGFFALDIVLNFFTAVYTADLEIIDDQKV